MAEFTQATPQAQGPGSYVGLSEGIRGSGNTSVATLFEGLADALKQGVAVVDNSIKQKIEQDVFDAVDSVQAEFGIPEATDLQSNAQEAAFRTMPAGVQRAGNQLQTLQAAYAAGNLKESHYWARMNSMVRQLRGKYPGYRGEIDQMVASVTGARPANALRSALFREWEAATSAQGQSEEDKFVNQNLAFLPPDYFEKKGTPQQYDFDQVRAHVATQKQFQQALETRAAQMNLESKTNTLTKSTVKENFNADATQIIYSTLMNVNAGLGASFSEIQGKIQQFQDRVAGGDQVSAVEIQQLAGAVSSMAAEAEMLLNNHYAQNPNYTTHLEQSDVDNSISLAMRPIRLLQDAMANQDFGLMKSVAAQIEAQSHDAQRELIKNVPQLENLAALRQLIGADGMQMAMMVDDRGRSVLTQVLSDSAKSGFLLGNTTLTDSFNEGISKGADAEYYQVLSDWRGVLDAAEQGKVPSETFDNHIQSMFGSTDILTDRRYFKNDKSRFEFFAKIASPEMSKRMINLKNKGHTEAWKTYQRFIAEAFPSLFMSKIGTIQDMVTDPEALSRVRWDNENGQFSFDLRLYGNSYIRHPLSSQMQELNQALRVVKPIIDEGGGDTAMELLDILSDMGYDPDAPRRDNPVSMLIKALTGSKKEEDDGSASE